MALEVIQQLFPVSLSLLHKYFFIAFSSPSTLQKTIPVQFTSSLFNLILIKFVFQMISDKQFRDKLNINARIDSVLKIDSAFYIVIGLLLNLQHSLVTHEKN